MTTRRDLLTTAHRRRVEHRLSVAADKSLAVRRTCIKSNKSKGPSAGSQHRLSVPVCHSWRADVGDVALLLGGFVLLVIGGELLVRGAVAVAEKLGMSPLLIGLTLVGLGTSAPNS